MEQVPGFRDHAEFTLIQRIFEWAGYSLLFERRMELSHLAPVKRERWLGLYVLDHLHRPFFTPRPWPSIPCTPRNFDMIQPLTMAELGEFEPTVQDANRYFDPKYTPGPSREWAKTQILKARIPSLDHKLPTIMATYGRHHLLSDNQMGGKGMYGHFVRTGPAFRYWTPPEVAVMHVLVNPQVLLKPKELSWHMLGNAIATPHAVWMLSHAFCILGWINLDFDVEEAMKKMVQPRFTMTFHHGSTGQHCVVCGYPGTESQAFCIGAVFHATIGMDTRPIHANMAAGHLL